MDKSLLEDVAKQLTKRKVQVRLQQPFGDKTAGSAHKSLGVGVIDIAPDLPEDKQLQVFLHECAHVLKDWVSLPDYPAFLDNKPGAWKMSAKDVADKVADPREPGAGKQAGEWATWAERMAMYYAPHDADIRDKLFCLLSYPNQPALTKAQIEKIVNDVLREV
jgi:hypothetical protein